MNKSRPVFLIIAIQLLSLLMAGCMSTSDQMSKKEMEADKLKVELENGVIEGNIVANVLPDKDKDGVIPPSSGDMLYMQDSGSISVKFMVPEEGDYIVKIYYAIPASFGDKANNVEINGVDLGELPFPQTQCKWASKWIQAPLVKGENTLSILHNWGYTWFDYLTVEKID